MEITQASGEMISISEAFITAVMGYALVFFGMILLILVIVIVNRIIRARQSGKEKTIDSVPTEKESTVSVPAPGSAGEVKLNNVSERDAAIIMAITANKLGKPLNELRFISIKEIEQSDKKDGESVKESR